MLIILIAAGLFAGCGVSDSKKIVDNREIVNGLYFTDGFSPEIRYVFDTPANLVSVEILVDSTSSGIPKEFMVETPYPNPANGNPSINLSVPVRTHVKGWIEEARWKNEAKKEVETPRTIPLVDEELQAGYHLFKPRMDSKCQNGDFDDGFYRIKFQAYDTTLFVDMYLIGYLENMPDSMQVMFENSIYVCNE